MKIMFTSSFDVLVLLNRRILIVQHTAALTNHIICLIINFVDAMAR